MAKQTFGIVVTTIHDGSFLDEYFDHFQQYGYLDRVSFYVVGDLSTPEECQQKVEKYRAEGLQNWHYLGEKEQKAFLAPFPELAAEIPWKSDNRRNVGFLMAYSDKCDVIVTIDDDNFPKPEWPFLDSTGHASVGQELELKTAVGYRNWFNLCSTMDVTCKSMNEGDTIYARGFPYERRDVRCGLVSDTMTLGRVGINAGLWSGDPDVDAATRLVTRCHVSENFSESYFLGSEVLSPINTQNTALIRAAIPAYYYVKMGHPVGGMKLDRFSDIFSGFFLQKCARAVGDKIRIGAPVVDHRRSRHNLYKDLWHELAGMVIIDDMLSLLETPLPKARTYSEAALSLAQAIREWAMPQKGFLWDSELKAYFQTIANNICIWTEVTTALSS